MLGKQGSDNGIYCFHFGSVAKHLESANTMFSFIWWIIGFYWVSAGGPDLTTESPQLYWLCITFLAFDVFFVVICVAVACVIGIAVCCCLPCIIAILYALADQEEHCRRLEGSSAQQKMKAPMIMGLKDVYCR